MLCYYVDVGIFVCFVFNVDFVDLIVMFVDLDFVIMFFIVVLKMFLMLEILINVIVVCCWLIDVLGDVVVLWYFVVVFINKCLVDDFGINIDNMFGFWDWVGGCYLVDLVIGLLLMMVIGCDVFVDFLVGFYIIDCYFVIVLLEFNVLVLFGLIGLWYFNFFGV